MSDIPSTLEHATLLTKNVSTDVSHNQHISQHPDMNIRGKVSSHIVIHKVYTSQSKIQIQLIVMITVIF